jgi:hypothetical protein
MGDWVAWNQGGLDLLMNKLRTRSHEKRQFRFRTNSEIVAMKE